MPHTLTVQVSDAAYKQIISIAEPLGKTPEEVAGEWMEGTAQSIAEDPLLQLAGTLESDVMDVGVRHDYYIGQALLAEMRGEDGK